MTAPLKLFSGAKPKNLKLGEEVYTVGADLVTVGVTRIPSPNPNAIVLELTGRKIKPDGTSLDIELPIHRHTVMLEALAEGTTPDQIITDLKALAFERWPAYLAGLDAFKDIPMKT